MLRRNSLITFEQKKKHKWHENHWNKNTVKTRKSARERMRAEKEPEMAKHHKGTRSEACTGDTCQWSRQSLTFSPLKWLAQTRCSMKCLREENWLSPLFFLLDGMQMEKHAHAVFIMRLMSLQNVVINT